MGCNSSSNRNEVKSVVPASEYDDKQKDTGAEVGNTAPANPPSGGEEVPDRYYKRVRRTSVSAESMDPTKVELVVNPKSDHEKAQIKEFIQNSSSFLFKGTPEEKVNQIADAMKKVTVDADVPVIRQGDDGDLFYLVAEGELEVFLKRAESSEKEKVANYGPGASFGELALMYLCPRAATVIAVTPCTLWTLDRVQFQALICGDDAQQLLKPVWEDLLGEVELLRKLNKFEIMTLADAMEEECCGKGEVVIQQGEEEGRFFYIVESGELKAELDLGDGTPVIQCKDYARGEYFGELAVLERGPQRVTVRVASEECLLLKVSADDFEKVLIPIKADLEAASDAFYAMLFSRVSQSDMELTNE